jgi:hypothetical protein
MTKFHKLIINNYLTIKVYCITISRDKFDDGIEIEVWCSDIAKHCMF